MTSLGICYAIERQLVLTLRKHNEKYNIQIHAQALLRELYSSVGSQTLNEFLLLLISSPCAICSLQNPIHE